MKVLNFGSLNIDYVYKVDHIVQRGETLSSQMLNVYPGGKGLNQSVALGKAGIDVWHAGAIGEDGTFLVELLKEAGVDASHVKILSDVKSGHAIIQNDKEGDNCIVLYGGANQAITKEQVDRTLMDFDKGDYLILQNEINELDYIMEKAHEKGMKIVLNPSPANEMIQKLPLSYVDYFILNEIEAGQILGTDCTDEEELLNGLVKKFPEASVILTLGSKGSWFAKGSERNFQKIYPVEAVDTTAAGDTYTGYFVAGKLKEIPTAQAMELAAKASAITVTRPGASVAIPTREEVEEF